MQIRSPSAASLSRPCASHRGSRPVRLLHRHQLKCRSIASRQPEQQAGAAVQQQQQEGQQQQHQHPHAWRLQLRQLAGSVLLFLAASLAAAGRQQAAAAATLPPQTHTLASPGSGSSGRCASSSSSSRLFSDFPEDLSSSSRGTLLDSSSSSSSRYGQLSSGTGGPQPLLSTAAAAPSSSSSSPAAASLPPQQQQQPGSGLDDLLAYEQAAVTLFQRAKPSVVNITHMRAMPHFYTLDIHRMAVGQGSGFIWDRNGHVVTNYHVIKGAAEVKVTLHDHSSCTARVVGYDAAKDIAVLKLALPRGRLEGLQPVSIGSSSRLRVGQACFAIGNPFGLDHTLTQGIVSGVGRELSSGLSSIKGVIQTDAAINPGNSGGVLLDSRGNVIGVNIGILDPGGKGSFSGVGFAIPIDTVKGLVDQILVHGRVRRPSLGITTAPTQVLDQLNMEGVLILEVPAATPAAAAGLRPTYRDVFGDIVLGDVIVGIDTRPVRSFADLIAALDERRPGDKVRCDVLREGKRLSVTVTLGERGAYCE